MKTLKEWAELINGRRNMSEAKSDTGKPKLSLVPSQILEDIAIVREYGTKKYGDDPENWKQVELDRYVNAMYRHWIKFVENPQGVDEESGIEHYKHCACNMAFICSLMMKNKTEEDVQDA